MSACISRHGEYGEHEYVPEVLGCALCGEVDPSQVWDHCAATAFQFGHLDLESVVEVKRINPYRYGDAA